MNSVLTAFGILVMCAGSSVAQDLAVEIELEKYEYLLGEPLVGMLTITNEESETVVLYSGIFDDDNLVRHEITDTGGRVVRVLAEGMPQTHTPYRRIVLAPGESVYKPIFVLQAYGQAALGSVGKFAYRVRMLVSYSRGQDVGSSEVVGGSRSFVVRGAGCGYDYYMGIIKHMTMAVMAYRYNVSAVPELAQKVHREDRLCEYAGAMRGIMVMNSGGSAIKQLYTGRGAQLNKSQEVLEYIEKSRGQYSQRGGVIDRYLFRLEAMLSADKSRAVNDEYRGGDVLIWHY